MSNVFKSMKSELTPAQLSRLKIREVMNVIASEPFLLCEVVAGGESHWRRIAADAFKGVPFSDEIADQMFLFFCGAVQALFGAGGSETFQSEHVEAAAIAGDFLDSCAPVTPVSDEDIRKGWTIEERSSHEHQRQQYGDLSPQEWLNRVVSMDEDQAKGAN